MSISIKRPYIVCHMLTSLDGKIDGAYMSDPACSPALSAFGQARSFYNCQATLYGTVTMRGSYSDEVVLPLPKHDSIPEYEDFIADCSIGNYIISVDPAGSLGFSSGYIEKKGRPKAHVIEILTKQVSASYLEYLQSRGVSYLFAGEQFLDCGLLLQKLSERFHIDRLMVSGGGFMNYSFLHEGLIDELSLIVAPLADGNTSSVSIFERSEFLEETAPSHFSLKEAKVMDSSVLWLRYETKK